MDSAFLIVHPQNPGSNPETLKDNSFQTSESVMLVPRARAQFKSFVQRLKAEGFEVLEVEDKSMSPDVWFPNNWFTHFGDKLYLFPMLSELRREEVQLSHVEAMAKRRGIREVVDLRSWLAKEEFLEGTGSLIFDPDNNRAYAALSERTCPNVLKDFELRSGVEIITFESEFEEKAIYHTNVLMSIGPGIAVICSDVIDNPKPVLDLLSQDKEILEISIDQLKAFCGNVFFARKDGEDYCLMSSTSRNAFTADQLDLIQTKAQVIDFEVDAIEALGGGSVRCMLGEF